MVFRRHLGRFLVLFLGALEVCGLLMSLCVQRGRARGNGGIWGSEERGWDGLTPLLLVGEKGEEDEADEPAREDEVCGVEFVAG